MSGLDMVWVRLSHRSVKNCWMAESTIPMHLLIGFRKSKCSMCGLWEICAHGITKADTLQ